MSTTKVVALLLDLPGAPLTPHTVGDLPGLYRTDRATPVGGIGECTEQQAKDAAANPNVPLKLTKVESAEVDQLRAQAAEDRRPTAA